MIIQIAGLLMFVGLLVIVTCLAALALLAIGTWVLEIVTDKIKEVTQ